MDEWASYRSRRLLLDSMTARVKKVKSIKRKRLVSKQKVFKHHVQKHKSRILSARGLAKVLGVSDRTVYKLARLGKIPSMRLGNLWRFDLAKVLHRIQIKPK